MRRTLTLVIGLLAALSSHASAQRESRDAGIPSGYSPMTWFAKQDQTRGFFRLPGIGTDYRIGPADELEIFITNFSQESVSVRVTNTGAITIPLLGTMQVTDLTTEELEAGIIGRLKEKKLIEQPEVLVHVAEFRARPIYIVGDVDYPGEYVMSQQLTLMEAILMAGGIDFPAGRYGYLHRRLSEGGPEAPTEHMIKNPEVAGANHEVIKVDLQPLKQGGVLDPDIPMRRGDIFVVPRRKIGVIYVIGDVLKPGPFEIPPENTMRVSQALAAGGGPAKTAKISKGVLVRYDAAGKRQELPVDFAAILHGRQADFDVQPNDVIFIPGATAKTLGLGMLNMVPGLIQTALIF
jgi:polysaccharide export outer membrane protein